MNQSRGSATETPYGACGAWRMTYDSDVVEVHHLRDLFGELRRGNGARATSTPMLSEGVVSAFSRTVVVHPT